LISNKGGIVRIKRSLSAIIATVFISALPLAASAQFSVGVGFTIGTPPPALPVYSQPPAPYPNWQWQPGYWAWGPAGYYWVPGTWVAPPAVGLYWTPGYWGYSNGNYGWNNGYWGTSVGFYGGINYGFGYPGTGFYGGTWGAGGFAYNTAVANVNRTVIHNTYNKTVINKNVCNDCKNVSYNGGKGGIQARPTPAQIEARHDGRAPTTAQTEHAKAAAEDRNLAASVNHGRPQVSALQRPATDPKAFPHSAPVTTTDRQHGSYSEQSQTHHYNQPPSGTMHSNYGQSHPERPSGAMQGHPPQGQHPQQQGQHPQQQGQHPQQQGQHPQQGHPNGQNGKPPQNGQPPSSKTRR
jgi:hypothetical protein